MALSDSEEQELAQLQKEKQLHTGGQTVKGTTLLRRSPMQKLSEERGQERAQDEKWSKRFDKQTAALGDKAIDAGAKMGLPPKVLAGMGAAVDTAARVTPDVIAGGVGGGLGSAAKVPLSSMSKGLMASALKVPDRIGPTIKKTDELVKTMLDKGITVSRGGVEKLRASIHEIQGHIDDIIVGSDKTVNMVRVGSELRDVFNKFKDDVLDGKKNIKLISEAWDDLKDNVGGKLNIPIQRAQDKKKATYRALDAVGAYERQTQNPLRIASKQAAARGLRKEIAAQEPAVADWNAQESKELAALEPLERRVLQEMRNNPVGLSLLAHSPEAMMGFVGDRSSKFKSILARMLYAREGSNAMRNTGAAGGVSLFEIGKLHNEDSLWDKQR